MSGKQRKLYWDTCVFLAWFKQETCWPSEVMDGMAQTMDEWRNGSLLLVTSSITLLEVLSSNLTIDQKNVISKTLSHRNVQVMDCDRRVSAKAAVIREFYDDRVFQPDGQVKSGRIIGMGDAIHLATALHYNVLDFQTLDGSGKHKRKFSLLDLDGSIAGARLSIKLPKFIPPPVVSDSPMSSTAGGQQLTLAEEFERAGKAACVHQIIALVRAAIDRNAFRLEKVTK